ncbi:Aminomethyltransferase, mitochondrial [Rhizina undulata]
MLLPRTFRSSTAILPRASRSVQAQCPKVLLPQLQTYRYYTSPPSTHPVEGKKTPLYELHLDHGAKMVPFAGYSMPVTYAAQGVGESHKFVREKGGLFDVSHMVQHQIEGPGALAFLHAITPSDLTQLKPFQSTLSTLLHPVTGGIVDDLIITQHSPESFFVVTNAACADKDAEYINSNLERFLANGGEHVTHKTINNGLIAVQGPLAAEVLQEYLTRNSHGKAIDVSTLYFGFSRFVEIQINGEVVKLHVARGGYTGEDGFEISIPEDATYEVTERILELGAQGDRLKPAGLGARDSLRLEAGMCLYGHDLDDTTTPIEAGLKWLVGKTRTMEGNFNGAETVSRQYDDWSLVDRRRVGFIVEGAPAREGAEIVNLADDSLLGKITSGCPSPTLGKNIAMGYIKSGFHKVGTEVGIKVRGKVRKGVVSKMPFVPAKYYKAPSV